MKIRAFLFGVILFLWSCEKNQTSQEKEKSTNKQLVQNQNEKDNKPLKGRIFIYALGCTWNSHSPTEGILFLETATKFKLKLRKGFNQRLVSKEYPNYFQYDYRDEILEGAYEVKESGKIHFQIHQYEYKDIKKREDDDLPYQKGKAPLAEIVAKIDSCENKLKLLFSPNKITPSEKYFEWVEKNYSGRYISYDEGVREELIVKDLQDSIRVYYLSPKYKSPIEMIVNQYKREMSIYNSTELKISFPNDSKTFYQVDFSKNYLTIYTQKDDTEEYNENRQRFNKIKNQFTDNPNDLSLKTLKFTNIEDKLKSVSVHDRIIPFIQNKKIKIISANEQDFKKTFQPIEFEKLRKKSCKEGKEQYNYACLQKIEAALLSKNKMVKREGDILIFQSNKGEQHFLKTFVTHGESTREFWYQGQFNSPKSLISITLGHFWEWGNYQIFHHQSGEEIEVTGTPYFSPNGKYLICHQNIGLYTMSGIHIQIWEIKDYGFDLIWQYQPYFIAKNFVWASDELIYFDIISFNQNGKENQGYGKLEILNR